MCPACYLNGFLFLIFGASGAAIASNPWVILIAIVLTLAGLYWMWKAWKRRSSGKTMKNLKNYLFALLTLVFITACDEDKILIQEQLDQNPLPPPPSGECGLSGEDVLPRLA